jgi:PadR family transcriptional regulator
MASDRIRGHLDLLVLTVVEDGPKHGYAIINDLRRRSEGHFDVPEGTVYPALHRLEERGLLESSWADGSTRRRRVYRITVEGREELVEERSSWAEFSAGVQSILGWAPCLQTI